jgi:hypothetical protein
MPSDFHFGPLKKDRQFLMHRYATVREADADFYAEVLADVRSARHLKPVTFRWSIYPPPVYLHLLKSLVAFKTIPPVSYAG